MHLNLSNNRFSVMAVMYMSLSCQRYILPGVCSVPIRKNAINKILRPDCVFT